VFLGILKRLYRSMKKEFQKRYMLNRRFLDSEVLRRPDGSFQQTTYEKQDNGDVRAVTVLVDLEGHVTTLDVTFDSDGKVLRQNVADARWAGVQTGAGSETKTDELDSEGNKVQPKEPPPSPQAVAFGQLVGLKPVWPKSTAGSQLGISGKVDGDVQRSVVLRRETDGTVTAAVTDTAPDGTTRQLAYRLDDDANVLATVTDFGTPQAADLGSGFWNAVDVPATDNRSNTGSNNWITRNFSLQPASSRPPSRGSYQSTVKNLPGGVKQNSQLVRGSDGQLRLLSTVTDVAGHTRSIFVDVPGALAASAKTVKQPTAETRSVTARSGQNFATHNFDSDRTAKFSLQQPISAAIKVQWIDGKHMSAVSGGDAYMFDFNGENVQKLVPSIEGLGSYFDNSYRSVFTFTAGANGKPFNVNRSSLTVKN
jgi:hypothetical protein